MTVHALWQGFALCRFTNSAPERWPFGHVWTKVEDLVNINCDVCKKEVMRRGKKEAEKQK